jgi:hypothetical protein
MMVLLNFCQYFILTPKLLDYILYIEGDLYLYSKTQLPN